jgi:hypothetical protein
MDGHMVMLCLAENYTDMDWIAREPVEGVGNHNIDLAVPDTLAQASELGPVKQLCSGEDFPDNALNHESVFSCVGTASCLLGAEAGVILLSDATHPTIDGSPWRVDGCPFGVA